MQFTAVTSDWFKSKARLKTPRLYHLGSQGESKCQAEIARLKLLESEEEGTEA